MNICVIATASRESGALAIYKQFINALKNEVGSDRYCIFIDPSMPQEEINGVEYVTYDTRGIRRVAFDAYGFKKKIESIGFEPEVIVSFQNVAVAYPKARQIVYFHAIAPLADKIWNPFVKEERNLFFYRSLYPVYVAHYLKPDMKVVVQAKFVKELFVKKFGFNSENVFVLHPDIKLPDRGLKSTYDFEEGTFNFVYPVTYIKYKNHDLLIEAVNALRRISPEIFKHLKIHLTFNSKKAPDFVRKISRNGCENVFVLHGAINHTVLIDMLASSNGLLFPSTLETLGVPLLEAASLGLPVVVSDLPYSHETLGEYEGAVFINSQDPQSWAFEIASLCNNTPNYKLYKSESNNSWVELFKLIRSER